VNFPLPNDLFPEFKVINSFIAEYCPDYVGVTAVLVVKEATRRIHKAGKRTGAEKACAAVEEDLRILLKQTLSQHRVSPTPQQVLLDEDGTFRVAVWALAEAIRPSLAAQHGHLEIP
jgi:hypothetical protein